MNKMFTYLMALSLLVTAPSCVEQDGPVITDRDLEGTATFFNSSDEQKFSVYYKPYVGYVADPMPFYDPVAEDYKIMYLQDYRPNQVGTYHPLWAVSTKDAASYVSLGELVSCGGLAEQDAAIGTGSVIYNPHDNLYYVFYTGNKHNPSSSDFPQAVMYATSPDFVTWTKCRTFFLDGPSDGYSRNDFRDPHVFVDESGMFHMLVSTRKDGKGVLAEYTSSDMKTWNHAGVFMTMMWDRFYECPDVFKMGDWWYLIYSEIHSAVRKVQYFKGKTLAELKACTANDAGRWPDSKEGFLDSRGFYAGKTASDGTDRYIWGWCADRPGQDNLNAYDWGGNLVAHKLQQNEDGSLVGVPVPAFAESFAGKEVELKIMGQSKEGVTALDEGYAMNSGAYLLFNRLGVRNKITFKATVSSSSDRFGVSFVRGTDSEKYYTCMFNPEGSGKMKVNFEQEGDNAKGFIEGSDSYVFSAPADMVYNVSIYTDNSVMTMYVNDVLTYTCRIYQLPKNPWSLNCYVGSVSVTDIHVSKY